MPVTPPNLEEKTAADEASATQHLYQLPKMSPTAGVGTEEYVAINVAAVISLLLGFASILAIMNNVLVVVAVVGVIVAVSALRQIGRSNGTQAGGGIAMAGLFLALSIGSFAGASVVMDRMARAADNREIDQACRRFGQELTERRYDAAYDEFSQRFKSIESRQDFVSRLKTMQEGLDREGAGGGVGAINGARLGGDASFFTDVDTQAMTAQGEIDFTYQHADNFNPMAAGFRKSTQGWSISSIPDLFPRK